MTPPRSRLLLSFLILTGSLAAQPVTPDAVFDVWPTGTRADDTRELEAEHVLEGRPRPFYQITDVAHPTVSVFLPTAEQRNSTAILVCPGGGLQRLAIEHEGFEVSDWLRDQGFTVFMLKYRVPGPYTLGLQDAQRALRLIRSDAAKWNIDPDAIGTIGFSAGAEIAAWLATHYTDDHYPAIDAIDETPSQPNFTTLIYPGGLVQRNPFGAKAELVAGINDDTAPTFIVHAFDDFSQNSLHYALALKAAGVPTEVHLFQEGGHGFGVRLSGHPVGEWTQLYLQWLGSHGMLDAPAVRSFAATWLTDVDGTGPLPRLSASAPDTMLADAYAAQRRLVTTQLKSDTVAGFKGGAITAASQTSLQVDGPLSGILFASGQIDAGDSAPVVSVAPTDSTVVETEIGFRIAVDIGYHVLTPEQARDAVAEILPVIELPNTRSTRMGPTTGIDLVATNLGSARFLVGKALPPGSVDANAVTATLRRDGELLHTGHGNEAANGQWANLQAIINRIVDSGRTLRSGSLIISGALGPVDAAAPGHYVADYGDLGRIEFELTEAP